MRLKISECHFCFLILSHKKMKYNHVPLSISVHFTAMIHIECVCEENEVSFRVNYVKEL